MSRRVHEFVTIHEAPRRESTRRANGAAAEDAPTLPASDAQTFYVPGRTPGVDLGSGLDDPCAA